MFRIKNLLMLIAISGLLTSCGTPKTSKDEPAPPKKIWTVQANIASTPYYDGICGKADEYIVTRAQ